MNEDLINGFKSHSGPGPLDGIRVLDLGRYQAGPRCGLVFARLGADVIKVEPPGRGDESRSNSPRVRGQSSYWVQYNSGKRSLSVNLRTEEGKEVLRNLVKESDMLIQNFRPGTIDKMGFGYETLKALNPGIIMINVSAYGQYGPYHSRVGFDQVGQAISGLMSLNGEPDGRPTLVPFPLIDRITALHATIGALAALHERSRSGEGQAIEVCLADTAYTTVEIPVSTYLGSGEETPRAGNRYGSGDMYETKDGHVYIASYTSDNIFPRFAKVVGHPEWSEDPALSSRDGRAAFASEIEPILARWFATQTTKEATDALGEAGVPCSPVNDIQTASADPHMSERDVIVEVDDKRAGSIHVTGRVIKFSRSGMPVGRAPEIGEHTDDILSGILDMPEDEISELREQKVV